MWSLNLGKLLLLLGDHIHENLLATTRHNKHPDIPANLLHATTSASTGVSQSAKDLLRLAAHRLEVVRGLHLEQRGPGRELERGGAHGAADEVLHEVLNGLDEAGHLAELEADDLVLEELLAEGLTAEGVAVAVLEGDAAEAEGCDADPETLMGEGCVSGQRGYGTSHGIEGRKDRSRRRQPRKDERGSPSLESGGPRSCVFRR
jgi:hypothetical protein